MLDLSKEIKEKAEKMRYEMKEFTQDMSSEFRAVTGIVKEKAEKLSSEIRNRIIR